ncbi:hypothetical protein [Pontibacterium sp.]|uniref:hypothetical protein n=1 Tax=Pontibacterium sp. TaxID=2036026 RepID=UPI0035683CEA
MLNVRPETLKHRLTGEWVQPTAEEVREVLRVAELTGAAAGRLVGVSSRQVRRWAGDENKIPFGPWWDLLKHIGEAVESDDALLSVSRADADLFREWFNCVQDLADPGYLQAKDYEAASRLLRALGERVPNSIADKLKN